MGKDSAATGMYVPDPRNGKDRPTFFDVAAVIYAADTSFATIFGGAVMKTMKLSTQPGTGQRNYPESTTAPISNFPSAAQS